MAGTLLGLFAAGCGQSSRDTTAMPEPPAAEAPRPPLIGVINDKDCPLQFKDPAPAMQPGTDPDLSSQWHLKNDGTVAGGSGEDVRATAAWAQTRGEKVRVAVIDDGIDVTHEDLAPNVVPNASYNYRKSTFGNAWPLPCYERRDKDPEGDKHGTAVAGLIAARDFNGLGVAGVAPRADLVGYNAIYTNTSSDIADALIRDLALNGVYNNSWGSPDDRRLHTVDDSFIAAIQNGIMTGRNRKGAIYVFPGGNGGCNERQSGQRCDNSNYDGYTNKLGVITTCAVDADGLQPAYGERGANLLVCAPGSRGQTAARAGLDKPGLTTTQIQNDYRSDFIGTSGSTPLVSGVIALMLSANPELTWRDVRLILASTARQNDAVDLDTDPERRRGFGITGLNFSHKYGFGVANAEAAVGAAQTWTSVGGSTTLTKCGPYERQVDLPIPDSGGVGSTPQPVASAISVPPCSIGKIEFVEVKFTARHPMSGDLQVQLRSPQNLVSELADARSCSSPPSGACGDYDNFAFGSVRHMNEPVRTATLSDWTLQVADLRAAATGTFERWSVTFYGRP